MGDSDSCLCHCSLWKTLIVLQTAAGTNSGTSDEIWSFVGGKEKNLSSEKKASGLGSVWTSTAIDADPKLVASWLVGSRDAESAYEFMHDVAGRLRGRVQLTADSHKPYLEAVEAAFGADID